MASRKKRKPAKKRAVKKRVRGRGIAQRVHTSRATYTKQRTKRGRTVYRKNGRFTSKRSYTAAAAAPTAEIERVEFDRAARRGPQSLSPRTAWFTGNNIAGAYAEEILPGVKRGDVLTDEQLRIVKADYRYVRGFEAFMIQRDKLSREDAEDQFAEMIEKLRTLKSATDRERVRIRYGLRGGSGFDARRARK